MLDQLGAALLAGRQRPRVGVGQQRARGIVELDAGEDLAHALGRAAISGECAATLTGSTMRSLGAQLLGRLGRAFDRGALATDHDLARASCDWRR